MTWLAYPIFNLMLFLHPYGRHALNREQRLQASLVGLCLSLGLGSFILSISRDAWFVPALVFGLLTLPVSSIFSCAQGWPRWLMIMITLGLMAAGLTAVAIISVVNPSSHSEMGQLGSGAFTVFLLGIFASQFLVNWLVTQRPQR
jgi:hypothetical protein